MELGDFSYNDWLTSEQECLDFAWDVDQPNVAVFCWVAADKTCRWTDRSNIVGCLKDGTGKRATKRVVAVNETVRKKHGKLPFVVDQPVL